MFSTELIEGFASINKDLLNNEIMQISVFDIVGLDYAGPFYSKCAYKRSVTKFVLHLPFHLHTNKGSGP